MKKRVHTPKIGAPGNNLATVQKTGITLTGPMGLSFPKTIGIKDFDNVAVVLPLLSELALQADKRKLSLDDIAGALGVKGSSSVMGYTSYSPEQSDIVKNISIAFELEQDPEERNRLWRLLDFAMKYEILIPETDSVNIIIYDLFEIEPEMIRKAFMKKFGFAKPDEGAVNKSVAYGIWDAETAGQLVTILQQLPRQDIPDILKSFNPGVLYLLISHEVNAYVGIEVEKRTEIMCALHYEDLIPADCPLFQFIQENAHEVFEHLRTNFLNSDFTTSRHQIHEETDRLYGEKMARYTEQPQTDEEIIEQLVDQIDKNEIS
jgi:hypothetical protein